jgi:hypothetical protein
MSDAKNVGGAHVLNQCSIYMGGTDEEHKNLRENEPSLNQVPPRNDAGMTSLYHGVQNFHFVLKERGDYALDDQQR